MLGIAPVVLTLLLFPVAGPARNGPFLDLPRRPLAAMSGSVFAKSIEDLPLQAREERIEKEVLSGNVPSFLRSFQPVDVSSSENGAVHTGRLFVLTDYLAVGSDADYLYVPTTPYTAQRLADRLHCLLPTPKIVDAIYASAKNRLTPSPIPPAAAMTSVPWFEAISQTIASQRAGLPTDALTAGDKKDIVICRALKDTPGRVAIYGWHKPDGNPIQPLYLGHIATWADYSHGTRLVFEKMEVDGKMRRVREVLSDPALAGLVSGEGVIAQPRYVFHVFPHPPDNSIHTLPGEETTIFSPMKGVRVLIDAPSRLKAKVRLVLFALPNGNTIEQTMGRKMQPDDDWHFDIQHIAAQTRFVRDSKKDESLVVAYIEAANHAWPTWLRSGDPKSTLAIVDSVVSRFREHDLSVTLDSHSGGGAFEFAYLDSVEAIPAWIDRIAFLDSEYNYDSAVHSKKLADWLGADNHFLCAIAYDDASALYDGKPVVSAEGGTWGRTHKMLADLGTAFKIDRVNSGDPEKYLGLDGRICFWLKENPNHQIFHTVQVEKNGFIESLLSGTPLEGKRYRYFGARAYSRFIAS
jgi:hypothetical protein